MIATSRKASPTTEVRRRLGPIDVLALSAWCGLAAGELEVIARFLYVRFSSADRMYLMPRHFVWLVPLINLCLFAGMGVLLSGATKLWPRRGGWLSPRVIGAFAILPALLVVGHQIYLEAWLIFAMGIAALAAPAIERRAGGARKWLASSFVVLIGVVLVQAGLIFGGDRLKQWKEASRPLPPAGSPNVLLIVLDTVRADHLSLYGYRRPTSPALERLASRGVRFDGARAAAPWTLASHATMFTGRWPHELATRWMYPLRRDVPTLAEFLGVLGYATAGFVGNTLYCSYDSGLDRGFTHYEDYVLDKIAAARTCRLVDVAMKSLARIGLALGQSLPIGPFPFVHEQMARLLSPDERKDAGVVNREFLRWLSRRREPSRPFFAFLNFVDAHSPYVLPRGAVYRFGSAPETDADFMFLIDGWLQIDKRMVSPRARALASDSYDNCLGYLDERLGELFNQLQQQGVLDRTIVIVAADHGEGLGEHDLFDHGESLYRPEIRVPLVIVPRSEERSGRVVQETVSLRQIPATIAELVGAGGKSPFPGRSLTSLWRENASADSALRAGEGVLSELSAPNPNDPNQGRSPAYRGPLISLAEGDFVYIRNEGDGGEELFDARDDPRELTNRVGVEAMLPIVRRFRAELDQLKPTVQGGPDRLGSP
jgi:arylsulfatase A-like enzyme